VQLVNTLDIPAFILSKFRIVHTNPAASEMLPDFRPTDDILERTGLTQLPQPGTYMDITISGVIFQLRTVPMGDFCYCSMQPITIDSEVRHLLTAFDKPLSELSFGISSSMALTSAIEMFRKTSASKLTPQAREERENGFLHTMRKKMFYNFKIVRNIQLLLSAYYGRIKPKFEILNLAQTIEETISELNRELHHMGYHIRYDGRIDILNISGNKDLIERLILNLLSNSVKNSAPGSEIVVETQATERHAIIRVIDHGSNLHADMGKKIFPHNVKSEEESAGLGLSVVQTIAALHKGNVQFFNTPNGGLTAEVYLPNTFKRNYTLHSNILYNVGLSQVKVEFSDILDDQQYENSTSKAVNQR